MPTRNPRVNICVDPEQHALLVEFAHLQGRSAASVVKELLDAATPLLRKTVPLLRSAAQEIDNGPEAVEKRLLEVIMEVERVYMDADPAQLLLDVVTPPDAPAPSASEGGRDRKRRNTVGHAAHG